MKFFKKLIAWQNKNNQEHKEKREALAVFNILLQSNDKLPEINEMLKQGFELDSDHLARLCVIIANNASHYSTNGVTKEGAQIISSILNLSIKIMKEQYSKYKFHFPSPLEERNFGGTRLTMDSAEGNLYFCCQLLIKNVDLNAYSLADQNKISGYYKALLEKFKPHTHQSVLNRQILSPIVAQFDNLCDSSQTELNNRLAKVTQKMKENNFAPMASQQVQKMIESKASSPIEKQCVAIQNKILSIQHEYNSFVVGDDKVFLDRSLNQDIPKIISSYSATPKNISDKYFSLSGTSMEQDLNKLLTEMGNSINQLEDKYATIKAEQIKKDIQIHGQYLENKNSELKQPSSYQSASSGHLSMAKR